MGGRTIGETGYVTEMLPKEVVVSPEDPVSMVELQSAGYWRPINTCPVTAAKKTGDISL